MNRVLKLAAGFIITAITSMSMAAGALPPVTVYAPPVCLACVDWAQHLRDNGFTVRVEEVADIDAVKRRLKVPKDLESRHSASVAGYFVEGHVPAEDIKELLRDKPEALGITVPGLPRGAPGRELSQPFCETGCTILDSNPADREVRRELFNTLLVRPDGSTRIWARH